MITTLDVICSLYREKTLTESQASKALEFYVKHKPLEFLKSLDELKTNTPTWRAYRKLTHRVSGGVA